MRSQRFFDKLNDAVRDDPLAAGLIGLGLAWMIFGKSASVVRKTSAVAEAAGDTVDAATDSVAPIVSGTADHLRKAAAGMSEAMSEGVQAAASRISNVVGSRAGDGRSLASGFADLAERQPLALAVVGIAAGVAIASTFPSTAVEGRLMGSAGEKLRDDAREAGDTLVDKVGSVIEAASDEALEQDLTPSAFREVVTEGTTRLKAAAQAARDAVKK